MTQNSTIRDFINMALLTGGWMELDRLFLENQILALIGPVNDENEDESERKPKTSRELLDELLAIAEENQKLENDNPKEKREFISKLMALLTPPPSVVNALFSQHYDSSEKEATDYFYLMNLTNNRINEEASLKKNVKINHQNLLLQSKETTEKNQLMASCPYCFESEGYGLEQEANKRIIRMNLRGDSWGFYYVSEPLLKEHCIYTPENHEPLVMNRQLQETMLNLVDIYPHYFVSVDPEIIRLAPHGYLYGGEATTPLSLAENSFMFDIPGFVTVEASIVDWPTSVIRLKTTSKKNLINAMEYITLKWQQYSYPSLDIIAKDKEGKNLHSMIPVMRKEDNFYVVEMILQDDSEEFKPTSEYQELILEKAWPIDQLGIINLKPTQEVTEEMVEIISKSMEKQSIFRRPQEGQKAFLRFIDTL